MKKLTSLMAAAVTAALFLGTTGCVKEPWGPDDKIVGSWKMVNIKSYPYYDMRFEANGVVYFGPLIWGDRGEAYWRTHVSSAQTVWANYGGSAFWTTQGDRLVISAEKNDYSIEYTYRVDGANLWLVAYDNYEMHYTRL